MTYLTRSSSSEPDPNVSAPWFIIDASSAMNSVSWCRLLFSEKCSERYLCCLYMNRCMVNAVCPVPMASTFAALPVGASSTTLLLPSAMAAISAFATDVFPVPAYPLRIIHCRLSVSLIEAHTNSAIRAIAFCWSAVGTKGIAFLILLIHSSVIIVEGRGDGFSVHSPYCRLSSTKLYKNPV